MSAGLKTARTLPHQVQIRFAEHQRHKLVFLHAHAVLSSERAAHLHAKAHDLIAGGPGAPKLIGIAMIEKDQRVEISVSGVKNVSDDQAEALGDLLDPQQRGREFGARDHAIQHIVGWRYAADGAERLLAALPEQSAFTARRVPAYLARMMPEANFADFGGLRFGSFAQAFHLHQ